MLTTAAQNALPGVLIATLLIAVRHDVLEHRIPNALCALALTSGCVMHTLASGLGGLWFAVQGAAVGFIFLFPMYLLRGMGAGDVKLMAAVGSFLGPLGALFAAAAAMVIGALVGVAIIISRVMSRTRQARQAHAGLARAPGPASSINKERFPYAVAIAGGALILMWRQGQFAQLATLVTG